MSTTKRTGSGKALATATINNYCENLMGNETQQFQLVNDQLQQAKEKITSKKDTADYNGCMDMFKWAVFMPPDCLSQISKIEINFRALEVTVTETMLTRDKKFLDSETMDGIFKDCPIEAYFPEADTAKDNREFVAARRAGILDGYYFCIAYKRTLEKISEIHGIPSIMRLWGMVESAFNEVPAALDYLNDRQERLCKLVSAEPGDDETRAKKAEVLESCFSKLEYDKVELSEEWEKTADKQISDFTAFQPIGGAGSFVQKMFIRPK